MCGEEGSNSGSESYSSSRDSARQYFSQSQAMNYSSESSYSSARYDSGRSHYEESH